MLKSVLYAFLSQLIFLQVSFDMCDPSAASLCYVSMFPLCFDVNPLHVTRLVVYFPAILAHFVWVKLKIVAVLLLKLNLSLCRSYDLMTNVSAAFPHLTA